MAGKTWTAERDAELTRYWLAGVMSESQIGAAMGLTTDMIHGRVHRLKWRGLLAPRAKSPNAHEMQAPRPTSALPPPKPVQKPAAIPKERNVLPVGGVRIRQCLWVNGEPDRGAWSYCDAKTVPGKPYCLAHCLRAFRMPAENAGDGRMMA